MNILDEIISLVSEKIIVFKTVGTIIKLETRLAGLSIIPCLWSVGLLFLVVGGMWLLVQALLTYFFIEVFNNIPLGIFLTLSVNVGVFIILIYYIVYNLKRMSFEKTRAYLSHMERGRDESVEKTIDRRNSHDGKKITIPPGEGDIS